MNLLVGGTRHDLEIHPSKFGNRAVTIRFEDLKYPNWDAAAISRERAESFVGHEG